MGQMMLYDTTTKKWERYEVCEVRTPWRVAWARLRAFLRYARRHNSVFPYAPTEPNYELDPLTFEMRDRRAERRWLRAARRAEALERLHGALLSMVEMQRHIG